MSKRVVYFILYSLLALALQVTVLSYLPFWDKSPDLLLLLVICSGFFSGRHTGLYFGLSLGLLQDLLLGGLFGPYTISKTIIGALADIMADKVYKHSFLFPPLIIFVGSFLQELLVIALSPELLFEVQLGQVLISILPFASYNALIAFFVYIIFFFTILSGGNKYEW